MCIDVNNKWASCNLSDRSTGLLVVDQAVFYKTPSFITPITTFRYEYFKF